jgi:hypothetical protein
MMTSFGELALGLFACEAMKAAVGGASTNCNVSSTEIPLYITVASS